MHIRAAALKTVERHEGILPLARIRADRLAELRLRADDIEHIVADLEGQAERLGIFRRRLALLLVSAAAGHAHETGSIDHRRRFAVIDVHQLFLREHLTLALHVELLSAADTVFTRSLGQQARTLSTHLRRQ